MQMVDFIAGDRYMSKSETLINDFTYPHEKVFDIFFFFWEEDMILSCFFPEKRNKFG
jgi:hypothetical protein